MEQEWHKGKVRLHQRLGLRLFQQDVKQVWVNEIVISCYSLVSWHRPMEQVVLHYKYFGYLHQTSRSYDPVPFQI